MNLMRLPSSKKITYLAFFTAIALIFSYVETLIPINFGIPGVKIGLANIVSVLVLYLYGFIPAIIVAITRIILSGLLFGNMFSIIYSLAGAVLSIIIMNFIIKNDKFSLYGVSILGAVMHNLAQLTVAVFVVKQLKLGYYGPILILSGVIMGVLTGMISKEILKRVETYVRL